MYSITAEHRQPASQLPSFLYLKGRIFYYRYKLPKRYAMGSPSKEIRISLRTAYQSQAARMAAHLYALTTESLETWYMTSTNDFEENRKRIEALREMVRQEVNAILNEPNKHPATPAEIRKRLNGYLRHQLDEESVSSEIIPQAEIIQQDGSVERIDISEAFSEEADRLTKDIYTGNNFNMNFQDSILELVHNGVFDKSEITDENAEGLTNVFLAMKTSLARIRAARLKGDFSYEQPFYQAEYTPYPCAQITTQQEISKNAEVKKLFLRKLIEIYCETKLKDGAWNRRTLSDHKNRVMSLLRIIGDKPIGEITRQDMRMFRDTLQKLPPRWNALVEKSGLSIEDFIKKDGYETTLSIKSINVIVEAVSGMFSWAIREDFIDRNPAQGLGIKDIQPDVEKKPSLTNDDIKKIFFTGDYKKEAFKNPAYYWAPLIALYTGMRLEEICQWHCEDIYDEDGVFLIDIREESQDGLNDKILKTKNAKRKIPIHEDLLQLGLIEYRDELVQKNEIRFFPMLCKTEKSPKYGKQVGKAFSVLLKKKEISEGKSFHSIRHAFSNFFKVKNMHTDMFRQVFGHEIPNLAGRQYGDKFPTKQIYEELISKLCFDK